MKGAQAKLDGLTTQIKAQVEQLMTGNETEIKIIAQREAALEKAATQAESRYRISKRRASSSPSCRRTPTRMPDSSPASTPA